MDVITALAGAEPPNHRLQIEIEVTSDNVDPHDGQVREAIITALEPKMVGLLSDTEGTGELRIVSTTAISKTPIEPAAVDGIKIWGIRLQTMVPKN